MMPVLSNLVVVVPEATVQVMYKRGFRSTGRANGRTVTMSRWFPDDSEAMAEGRKLDGMFTWGVEKAR